MTGRPKGKSLEDQGVLGFLMDPQVLIGLIDFVYDDPSPGDGWIGLLLLDPAYRNQGLRLRIDRAFEAWATQCCAQRICLGVIEQNRGAYRFRRKAGFEPFKRPSERTAGGGEHRVIAVFRSL